MDCIARQCARAQLHAYTHMCTSIHAMTVLVDRACVRLLTCVLRCDALVIQGRLMTTEEKQIKSEQDLELERERTRQLNDEIARLKRAVEQSRSATPTSTDAARVSELETLLAQARADVGKFQALAEKNATAYQNAMARLFPALTSLSAR
jgi:hypothetical protein